MFDELSKYEETGHFFLTRKNSLRKVCNAPTDKSGVFIVYALVNGRVVLAYIGRSGEVKSDGSLLIRKSGLGGLKDSIVNGTFFGEPRHIGWKKEMKREKMDALDIYWYVTHNEEYIDCPKCLERQLIQSYIEIYRDYPPWNVNNI
jgi:hypothetical protein